jgi:hypothetical protein
MKKAEGIWMGDVASMGCVVCRNLGHGESPAEIHHIRKGQGMSQRASNYEVLPLCPPHHRTGGHGVAVHAGQKVWEKVFGTELLLLEQTVNDVKSLRGQIVGR